MDSYQRHRPPRSDDQPPAERGHQAPLPVVAVTGSVGKTTVACTLDRLARLAGQRSVVWVDSGVSIDGQPQAGELVPWSRGLQLVVQGELDLAVQELPAPMVQAVGLPAAAYQVAIVTNLALNEPVALTTARAEAQRLANTTVAGAVHPAGVLVLNADDHEVADLAGATSCSVTYFAVHRRCPPLARHLRRGGHGVYTANGRLVSEYQGQVTVLGDLKQVPMTFGGAAVMQVQNVLAAVAAALALGLRPETLASGLSQLSPEPYLAERQVLLEDGRRLRALVAGAPNSAAVRVLTRFVRRRAAGGRVVGVIGWSPALEEAAAEVARTWARLFSLVYVFGPGAERAAEVITEARPPDRPPAFCIAVESELAGVRRLMNMAAFGDTLLLVTDDVLATVALLDSYYHGARPVRVDG